MKCVNSAWLQKYLFREDHGWLKKKKGRWGGDFKSPPPALFKCNLVLGCEPFAAC